MVTDAELAGMDPFDLLDTEAGRIEAHLSGLSGGAWQAPSRCAGWSVRDVLAHLLACEDYHRACLEGTVRQFLDRQAEAGVTSLAESNDLGIAAFGSRTPEEILAAWQASSAETCRLFRERGDGRIDSSIGDYPCRWQAFHVAGELATHADDMFVPSAGSDAERVRWRARFSRFALAEAKPDLEINVTDRGTRVVGGGVDVVVGDDVLVEAVAGRYPGGAELRADEVAALNTMP